MSSSEIDPSSVAPDKHSDSSKRPPFRCHMECLFASNGLLENGFVDKSELKAFP